jgi:hypothetical protein
MEPNHIAARKNQVSIQIEHRTLKDLSRVLLQLMERVLRNPVQVSEAFQICVITHWQSRFITKLRTHAHKGPGYKIVIPINLSEFLLIEQTIDDLYPDLDTWERHMFQTELVDRIYKELWKVVPFTTKPQTVWDVDRIRQMSG